MASREGPNPAFAEVRRRVSRRFAGAYFLIVMAWIVNCDLALIESSIEFPGLSGAPLDRIPATGAP